MWVLMRFNNTGCCFLYGRGRLVFFYSSVISTFRAVAVGENNTHNNPRMNQL